MTYFFICSDKVRMGHPQEVQAPSGFVKVPVLLADVLIILSDWRKLLALLMLRYILAISPSCRIAILHWFQSCCVKAGTSSSFTGWSQPCIEAALMNVMVLTTIFAIIFDSQIAWCVTLLRWYYTVFVTRQAPVMNWWQTVKSPAPAALSHCKIELQPLESCLTHFRVVFKITCMFLYEFNFWGLLPETTLSAGSTSSLVNGPWINAIH